VEWSWDQKGQRRYVLYENNLVLIRQSLYVCALGASYPTLSSWRKIFSHNLRLGERKKHKSAQRTLQGTRCESWFMRLSPNVVVCLIHKIWCHDNAWLNVRLNICRPIIGFTEVNTVKCKKRVKDMTFGNRWNFGFAGLNFPFHTSDHLDKVWQSRVKTWWRWRGQLEENSNAVSSANYEIEDSMDSAMSLTYTRNNKGPRTEPCGTPQFV